MVTPSLNEVVFYCGVDQDESNKGNICEELYILISVSRDTLGISTLAEPFGHRYLNQTLEWADSVMFDIMEF